MDLTSLNSGYAGAERGAYGNADVETKVVFDQETGRPYYIAVPVETRVPDRIPQHYAPVPTGSAAVPMVIHQPMPMPYQYGPPAPPERYSPVHDPIVCRLLAGAVAIVAGAFALSFVLAALAAAETALGLLLGILALIWLMSSGKGGGSGKEINIKINNSNTSRRRG